MLWNSLLKNPILAIGILLFAIFIMQLGSQGKLKSLRNEKLIPTSCKAAIVKIQRTTPGNWNVFCESNNMAVEIEENMIPPDAQNIKSLMYRQLANHMSYLARASEPDILEKVHLIRLKMVHSQMEINAVTEGKFIVKLVNLESPDHIMAHLKSTVQVQETVR
jgi:hypothetical protein